MPLASSKGVLGLDGLKKEKDISPKNQWNTNIDDDDDQIIELRDDPMEFVVMEKLMEFLGSTDDIDSKDCSGSRLLNYESRKLSSAY